MNTVVVNSSQDLQAIDGVANHDRDIAVSRGFVGGAMSGSIAFVGGIIGGDGDCTGEMDDEVAERYLSALVYSGCRGRADFRYRPRPLRVKLSTSWGHIQLSHKHEARNHYSSFPSSNAVGLSA